MANASSANIATFSTNAKKHYKTQQTNTSRTKVSAYKTFHNLLKTFQQTSRLISTKTLPLQK